MTDRIGANFGVELILSSTIWAAIEVANSRASQKTICLKHFGNRSVDVLILDFELKSYTQKTYNSTN